jgi:hypothetical protein
MRRQAIKGEAEKLFTEFGTGAYEKAREAMREARRCRNMWLERYFAKVAVAITQRAGKQVRADTATQYLESGL